MSLARSILGRELPPRVHIVQAHLDRFRRARYLEIGVNVGALFLHVRAATKVAVDPRPAIPRWKWLAHPNTASSGRLVEKTSDAFFQALPHDERFDVVFVDGLHTYEQSLRDVEHSLEHLSPDGVVLIHDCNPTDALMGGPDPAATGDSGWCGEVWKTIVHLRARRRDVIVDTLETDFGIGVVRWGTPPRLIEADPEALGYEDLDRDREELLGLRAP